MSYTSTLDIDTNDKFIIQRFLLKICECEFIQSMIVQFSQHKGVHVSLGCMVECDICRFCYDDFRRFAFDQCRPKYARNILFNVKQSLNRVHTHTRYSNRGEKGK